MRVALLVGLLFAATAASGATVYKWVDDRGVTHYSDQPHPGAEKIELGSVQTYSGGPASPATAATPAAPAAAPPSGAPYQACELFNPANDEVFLNAFEITARLSVRPALRPGDRIALALDGRRVDREVTGSEVAVPVSRGTHTLLLVVEDRRGEVVCQSDTVTFHVRQPSVQAPNPANRPRF